MKHPQQRTARVAGILYLVVVLSSPFVLMYAPGKLFVAGDPVATVTTLQANVPLFRAYILVGLVSEVIFVATVLALYRLFRDVDRDLAALMVVAIMLIAPLALLGTGYQIATLRLLSDSQPLAAFDPMARDALILFLPMLDRMATPVHVLFWGLWQLGVKAPWAAPAQRLNDGSVPAIGAGLLTTYSMAFELISIALLVAIIGALAVARGGRGHGT